MGSKTPGLTIAAPAGAPLGPEQRKYDQLVARIEKARAELLAWQDAAASFAQAASQRLQPLLVELAAQRRQLVLRLAGLLAAGGWNKAERRVMRRALCAGAAELVGNECIDAATAAELEALHDRYAETSLEDERREALAGMKIVLEATSGVDLGDEDFASTDELIGRAREVLREDAERRGQQAAAQPPHPGRQTAAQRKREAQAQEASQSVREVYRKLASALHPDRSSDEVDHARRTVLMQRVNQAYAAQDLLGLFALQLEIEQVDSEHLAQAGTARLRHYNRVLSAQLAELHDGIESRRAAFAMEFAFDPWLRPNPRKLGPLLDERVRQVRAVLAHSQLEQRLLDDPAGTRRWVRQARQEQKRADDDAFNPYF